MRGVLQSQLELPDEFEHAQYDLRPKLWMRAAFTKLTLRQTHEGVKTVDAPRYLLGKHLCLGIVYDLPNSMRAITDNDLAAWNTSWYEAFETSRQSLAECDFTFARIGERLYASCTGDNHDASRILLPALIDRLQIDGTPVAMVPKRDCLLVTGENDKEGIELMVELARQALDDPWPMSPYPLKLAGDHWIDWMPDESQPAYTDLLQLQTRFLHREYADQKALLDQSCAQEESPVFVASCVAVEDREAGTIETYCVWCEGVDSLLPRTDRIMLTLEDGRVASGTWKDVAAVVTDLIVLDETYYPDRYRVREFPSRNQLKSIGFEN